MSEQMILPVAAGADHRANQYRVLQIAGTLATTAINGRGILQNKPNSTEDASLMVTGRSKAIVGSGGVAAGAYVTVASGGFIVTCLSGGAACGFVEAAANSGSAVWGQFNFATLGILNA
jgi:hypothetical protein